MITIANRNTYTQEEIALFHIHELTNAHDWLVLNSWPNYKLHT